MKKAYSVQADESGCVIFAEHNIVARRLGASQLGCEFEEIESCRRAPEFDHFRDTEIVPAKAKIEAGWRYECEQCREHVYDDTPDIRYGAGHDEVFCSEACQHAHAAEQVILERMQQAAIDCVCERWPGVVPEKIGGFARDSRHVTFSFPGGQYAASWTVGEDSMTVVPEDHPAWAAFTGKPIEIVPTRRA